MENKGLTKSKCFALLLVSIPKAKPNDNNSGAFASDEEELDDEDANENSENNSNLNNHGELTPSLANPDSISGILTKLEDQGPTLIAGYGIQWNIKWESQDCAYQGHNIISRFIENEKDQQERDGGKNLFDDHEISRGEWEVVKQLNDILSDFYLMAKKWKATILPEAFSWSNMSP
ncbi:hypothetical protein PGT21_026694 [Puccinia graminis f. sp. tritici]|uniref:Uncharacterized protein n=1 Tax=Puccinia graminis f. sp. tritici TaxID=56615 RepID=A0A5B0SB40_PUCGR|nr:hypothetical protein PGT21_026694 [Puccinia graminis f. sp. tritici]KAA1135168.1 hypothetical protein PGTUg99_004701 [Puccinia graminis f. sp. tritici]